MTARAGEVGLLPWEGHELEAAFKGGLAQEATDAIAERRPFKQSLAAWKASMAVSAALAAKLEEAEKVIGAAEANNAARTARDEVNYDECDDDEQFETRLTACDEEVTRTEIDLDAALAAYRAGKEKA